MEDINKKIGNGLLWNLSGLLLSRGASTLFMLFLARLLAPDAFGLMAMVAVIFELANTFVQSGLGAALIRSKSVSAVDLDTVFYTNLSLSLLAYGIIFLIAPYAANFYNQPELVMLVRVMGLVVFFNALKIVQVSVFSRDMNFKSQMKANTLATVLSGILAVVAAYRGLEVWSLVVQMLSQAALSALFLWRVSRWRPGKHFSPESFFRLFKFSRNLLAEGILQVAFLNSYLLVIGKFFSAEITGLYFFSQKLSGFISKQLTGAMQTTTFPALATLQDDNAMLRIKYRQIMQFMMFVIAPIMMLMAAVAPSFILVFFGKKWEGAAPYLQLLCIVGILFPVHAMNINLLNVKGRSDLVFKIGLIKKSINISLLILAIPYGVLGIVFSQVISAFLGLIPNTHYSSKLVGYTLGNQLQDVGKPVISAVIGAGAAFAVLESMHSHRAMALIISLSAGMAGYIAVCLLLRESGVLMFLYKAREWSSKEKK